MVMMRRVVPVVCLVAAAALTGCTYLFNQPPVAVFDPQFPEIEGEPLVVVLDASGSYDPDGDPIVEYNWAVSKEGGDIGDGLVPYEPEGWTTTRVTEPILTVRFPAQGTYTVTLLVRSEHGGTLGSSEVVSHTFVLPNEQVSPTL
jgi:hypothetical protein